MYYLGIHARHAPSWWFAFTWPGRWCGHLPTSFSRGTNPGRRCHFSPYNIKVGIFHIYIYTYIWYMYIAYMSVYIYICIYVYVYTACIYICRYVYIIGKGYKPFAKWDAPPSRLLRGRLEWVCPFIEWYSNLRLRVLGALFGL